MRGQRSSEGNRNDDGFARCLPTLPRLPFVQAEVRFAFTPFPIMQIKRLLAALFLSAFCSAFLFAQTPATSPKEELAALVNQIKTKLQAGKSSAADLAPEIAAFDA